MAVRRWNPRRRFVRRIPRQGAWTGVGAQSATLTQGVTTSFYLWSDLTSQRLNMAGKGIHRRSLLWFATDGGGQAPFHFAWSVSVMATDNGNDVPTAMILAPVTEWASLCEKSPMDVGYEYLTPNNITAATYALPGHRNFNWHRDLQVKRRMDDTDAIIFSVQFVPTTGTGATQRFSLFSRTYVTW